MRIGVIVPGFSADAYDWCIPALRDLVEEFARHDDVWVLALRYPSPARHYSVFGTRVTALGGRTRRRLASVTLWAEAFAAIATEHRRQPFDVLHAFWADEAGAVAAIAGRVLRVPTVVSLAGGELVALADISYGSQLTSSGRLKVALGLRLASSVTAGSVYELGLAERWIRGERSRRSRIPLGVQLERFRPFADDVNPVAASPRRPERQAEPPHLLHVGSLVPVKDQATLLRAAAFARASGAHFVLDIVGAGPLDAKLRALATELDLGPVARFHGVIAHDNLPSMYRSAAAFVLSSRHEAQCLAVLEAAACGVATVGTAVGVVPELAPTASIAVPVGDARTLGVAISNLLDDRERLASMSRNTYQLVRNDYSLSSCVAKFRALFASIIRRPR